MTLAHTARDFLRRKFVRDTLALQIGKVGVTGMSLLSSVLVFRLLRPESYGVWALVQSFFTIWTALNLTGVGISTGTRLGMAVGAKDEGEILNLMGFFVQLSTGWALLLTTLMALLGPGLSQQLYGGDARIGTLAALLSLTFLPDSLYILVILSLQSQRAMRTLAVLQNINQAMLVLCVVLALAAAPTPEGMVAARLAYSVSTMLIALGFYGRTRRGFDVLFPAPVAVFRRAVTVSPRPYWRFGVANAIDKNIANLFTEIPLQLVGILAGKRAAGYLELGYRAITIPSMFSSAVFDNLQAVVPQAVGKRDFARLWRNFRRVALTLAVASAAFYTLFALVVPLAVPLVLGVESLPAIPVIVILSVYGAITTVGGILGPLYRAFNLLREATLVKVAALAVMALPGLWLVSQFGAVGGGWVVNGLHIVSVGLTALVVLPVLRRHAVRQEKTQTQENSAGQQSAPL